ncbi:hypothetical protein ACI7YT_12650 [Microbacterium sp. M]|uniref:hypothetical protein n=1 Tax=Microbacterium sp. M TaxID=3377125 RepID=UPI003867B391
MTTITNDIRDVEATSVGDALEYLQRAIGAANAEKGFHAEGDAFRASAEATEEGVGAFADDDRIAAAGPVSLRNYYAARLALLTTEVAEAIEELRNGRAVNETWYSAKVNGGTYAWNAGEQPEVLSDVIGKPEGVPSEVADVVIRAFDFADEAGFDLAAIIAEKLAYNATRGHKHGREF